MAGISWPPLEDYVREITTRQPILTHVCILAICPDCILQGYETKETAQAQADRRANAREDRMLSRYYAATGTTPVAGQAEAS